MFLNENDISAKEKTENERTRFQKENVHALGQKDFGIKKEKRQKVFNCVISAIRQEVRGVESFLPFLSDSKIYGFSVKTYPSEKIESLYTGM